MKNEVTGSRWEEMYWERARRGRRQCRKCGKMLPLTMFRMKREGDFYRTCIGCTPAQIDNRRVNEEQQMERGERLRVRRMYRRGELTMECKKVRK